MRKTQKTHQDLHFYTGKCCIFKGKEAHGGFVGFCQSKALQVHTVRRVNFQKKGCTQGGKE